MPIVKEYNCPICGPVENTRPKCPQCKTTKVERVFRTPPGVLNAGTKMKDRMMKITLDGQGILDYSNSPSRGKGAKYQDLYPEAKPEPYPTTSCPPGTIQGRWVNMATGEASGGDGKFLGVDIPQMQPQAGALPFIDQSPPEVTLPKMKTEIVAKHGDKNLVLKNLKGAE